jgi:hypothetical protein
MPGEGGDAHNPEESDQIAGSRDLIGDEHARQRDRVRCQQVEGTG